MTRKDFKERRDAEHVEADGEEVSVISATLPKIASCSRVLRRRIGFWPDTIEKCRHLEMNQAVKIRLLSGENPTNFSATARSVAKQKGFYLNCVYKYPFMYLWPDKMRGRALPQDYNSKGAVFFENEQELL